MAVQTVIEQDFATLLATRWEQTSKKIADLAEEVPAEKFESAPAPGIRTPAAILRHVAFWNQYVVRSLRGEDADDTENELAQAEYPDKQSILNELMRSSPEAATLLRDRSGSLTPQTAELMVTFIEHTSEHYGQLAVYCRLWGIVPPASRG